MGITWLCIGLVFAFVSCLHHSCLAGPGGTAEPFAFGSIEPVDGKLCQDMKDRHVLVDIFPSCARLRLVRFSYINFDGEIKTDGMIVVIDAISAQVLDLFRQLLEAKFPIKTAMLMNVYGGDDDASMARNNTSAFNDRKIPGKATNSLHSYGAAIDINPVQNPYVLRTGVKTEVKPPAGAGYLDRSAASIGMAEPVVQIFKNHGFLIWGGAWRNPQDFQHFQVSRDVAQKILALEPKEAREFFDKYVQNYRRCIAAATNQQSSS